MAGKKSRWDEATREMILEHLANPPTDLTVETEAFVGDQLNKIITRTAADFPQDEEINLAILHYCSEMYTDNQPGWAAFSNYLYHLADRAWKLRAWILAMDRLLGTERAPEKLRGMLQGRRQILLNKRGLITEILDDLGDPLPTAAQHVEEVFRWPYVHSAQRDDDAAIRDIERFGSTWRSISIRLILWERKTIVTGIIEFLPELLKPNHELFPISEHVDVLHENRPFDQGDAITMVHQTINSSIGQLKFGSHTTNINSHYKEFVFEYSINKQDERISPLVVEEIMGSPGQFYEMQPFLDRYLNLDRTRSHDGVAILMRPGIKIANLESSIHELVVEIATPAPQLSSSKVVWTSIDQQEVHSDLIERNDGERDDQYVYRVELTGSARPGLLTLVCHEVIQSVRTTPRLEPLPMPGQLGRMRAREPHLLDKVSDELFTSSELVSRLYNAIVDDIDPPFSICIQGAWGSGKTTLQRLLFDELQQNRYRVFWFNAWEYERMGMDIQYALLCKLAEEFKKTRLADNLGLLAAATFRGGVKFLDKIFTGGMISDFADEASLLAGKLSKLKFSDPIEQLQHDFRRITNNARKSQSKKYTPGPVVIFLDDLDRCLPENAMRLLEAMKNLFIVNGVNAVFVCGVDTGIIGEFVMDRYPTLDPVYSWNYLRKIFNLFVTIPSSPTRATLLKNRVHELLGKEDPSFSKALIDRLSTYSTAASLQLRNEVCILDEVFFLLRRWGPGMVPLDAVVLLLVLREGWIDHFQVVSALARQEPDAVVDDLLRRALPNDLYDSDPQLDSFKTRYLDSLEGFPADMLVRMGIL